MSRVKPATLFCFCKATALTAKPFAQPGGIAVPATWPFADEIVSATAFERGMLILLLAASVTALVEGPERLPPEKTIEAFAKFSAADADGGDKYFDPTRLTFAFVNPGA